LCASIARRTGRGSAVLCDTDRELEARVGERGLLVELEGACVAC
jgi:hypothetical protein